MSHCDKEPGRSRIDFKDVKNSLVTFRKNGESLVLRWATDFEKLLMSLKPTAVISLPVRDVRLA